jgi:hypothetical protein
MIRNSRRRMQTREAVQTSAARREDDYTATRCGIGEET